ncbi:hypothetical protein CORC01_12003 [Colletotrichum orchidophilum]|uniref:Uncharacterized protein n=1 Tax=Colletotrichum orchidophilum TaxID=1209926 RepID=A0A1G4AUI5_9PEZI|nr:uncharacterized protein CORC01_12003 [Colletotrichum orchidophilum]OHE92722.1 hypothetical protein CORC01_12003 [Colletotrichum orchidophilum]
MKYATLMSHSLVSPPREGNGEKLLAQCPGGTGDEGNDSVDDDGDGDAYDFESTPELRRVATRCKAKKRRNHNLAASHKT